ncbi:MAG: recombinase family protein [Cyanobacteria bacterium P01_F01_bin.53]
MTDRACAPEWSLPPEKLTPEHLGRLAVVYVRQSTLQQVVDHQESTRIQYGLVNRAAAWGWSADRIMVIDEDQGKSGASAEERSGFQRLVTEVGLNHVGLILGVDMSRLARCSKDWHQLLEICALFGTAIADLDGIYNPSDYNDRLLLGLKGTMSEAELHLIKQRMMQGRLSKARRGELSFALPSGYVRHPSGEVTFDPDEQAQRVIRLMFRKFEQLGSLNSVLHYFIDHDIRLGIRSRTGSNKGELEWRRPNKATLSCILKNPTYAGAYAYGRRKQDPRRQKSGCSAYGRTAFHPPDCAVLIKDHWPAYISWQQYEWNLAQLRSNRSRANQPGAVRHGPALLAGLLHCGKCGRRLSVNYLGRGLHHSYVCCYLAVHYGEPVCQRIGGTALDRFVSQQVLMALQPAALELSLSAAAHLEQEQKELEGWWQTRLERAEFEAQRAARHYQLVEPENRLVARQLAKEWENKLLAQKQLSEEYDRYVHQQTKSLSESERQEICQLASDIPALWSAPTTTNSQRKELIRQVVNRVVLEVENNSEQVSLTIEWAGGSSTPLRMTRDVFKYEQLSFYPQLCQKLRALVAADVDLESIAEQLTQAGYHPPKQTQQFSPLSVRRLIDRLGLV